ncbi:DegV family protein [Streptococcus equi subsp. zooepidemicus]|uniref:DegV family protein n=1 Tax=Streptococcus equi subsp. zooepidemicus (strain H70) TaxID=553483 RepID=C0MEJ6_STRS7|nr:DegV family protein [Streptococcus equi]KIS14426.1 DegV family protein [Streptococcus equi subsp. zooepidemicus SzAM60]MCD3399057.1 DegV family protein [Streptococcus equi subsp. zooepidemicus]MCD3451627.1 DegV family protein [Streptococcus equi subsp. zooepidemicus]MCD3465822.1 DegV family protein [Streptococcus equi subsp. zooepidemicus]CAW99088.1 DegV family protein [Streptococcus equi subsp. zooepidemicus]
MKLAVITDNTAHLPEQLAEHADIFVLDIPVIIDGQSYVEGQNLTIEAFYQSMRESQELPKTSQPSLSELDDLLGRLSTEHYTHVIGLFLASGISGFWQNIQFLIEEHPELTIAFPDSKITSAPLGSMVGNALEWSQQGLSFAEIMDKLEEQIAGTTAFIMVDDLNHLVKGGRLSNGSALLGNLLSIKPILRFDSEGKIVVYEKVRTEKKAMKRLVDILKELTASGQYEVSIIHARAQDKADILKQLLLDNGYTCPVEEVHFGAVIAAHLGEGAVAFGITPLV